MDDQPIHAAKRTGLLAAAIAMGAGPAACARPLPDTSCDSDGEAACVTEGTGSDDSGMPPATVGSADTTASDGPPTTSDATASLDATTAATTDDTSMSGCVMHSDCGLTERCDPTGICIELTSAVCSIVEWPAQGRDNVVFLGSIVPTSGYHSVEHASMENAIRLAIEDFDDHATLQSGQRIAWVGCDEAAGAGAALDAATHLRDVVGVPAIIGPAFSESTREIAEQVTVPAGIFVISPTASASSLSNFDDDNLVWRVTPNDVYQANALIDRFVSDLSPTPQRLLVLNKDDAYGNELRDLIQTDLVTDLPNVYFASYPGPETFASQEDLLSSYGEVLGIALSQPGIAQSGGAYNSPDDHYTHILILGTSEAEAFIVSYLGIWAQTYAPFPVPFPLITTSHGAVPNLPAIVANVGVAPGTEPLLPLRPLLYSSVRGTSPNIFDPDNFTAFNIRYRIRFNDQDAITSSSLGYDATMATMFAMVTVPEDQAVTGAGIAAGMASLNDPMGTPISFGDPVAVFIQDARNALAAGNTVDLQGVSGALDWDPDNGEIRAGVLGWRLGATPDMPALDPYCLYLLDAAPAEEGTWLNASTGMPPCG